MLSFPNSSWNSEARTYGPNQADSTDQTVSLCGLASEVGEGKIVQVVDARQNAPHAVDLRVVAVDLGQNQEDGEQKQ